jgi:hypothetical protein
MNPDPSYATAWQDCRRRRFIFVAFIVGFLPFGALVLSSEHWLPWGDYVAFASFICYALAITIASWRYHFWPCPRCGKSFRGMRPTIWMGKSCYYCKLPKWAEADGTLMDVPTQNPI